MTQAAKLTDWRERHPQKAAALETAICRRLGMRNGIKSDLAREAVEQWMASVLAALLGWGEEPEPERELVPPTRGGGLPPAEVIKALDLEIPHHLTGRDRAAGDRNDD